MRPPEQRNEPSTELSKKHRALMLRLESHMALASIGLRASPWDYGAADENPSTAGIEKSRPKNSVFGYRRGPCLLSEVSMTIEEPPRHEVIAERCDSNCGKTASSSKVALELENTRSV